MTSPTRNKTDGSWIRSMPVMRWNVHLACNQTCAYCVSGSSPRNDFGVIDDEQRMAEIDAFFAREGPFNVLFTGGEPLITPGIFDLFRRLVSYGHRITLQTNLKIGAEKFADAVAPENVGWITTTFHSVELDRFNRYLKNVIYLKDRGYPIAVKLVMDELLTPKFVPLYDELRANGIGVTLSPLAHFPDDREHHSHQYTLDEWRTIEPRMSMLSSWLFFAGGWRSKGHACNAGSRIFTIRPGLGNRILGCGYDFPRGLGYINEQITPALDTVKCGVDRCFCDTYQYAGITPDLDVSDDFERMLWGQTRHVPFAEYLAWLDRAGAKPFADLRPIMSQIGVYDGELPGNPSLEYIRIGNRISLPLAG